MPPPLRSTRSVGAIPYNIGRYKHIYAPVLSSRDRGPPQWVMGTTYHEVHTMGTHIWPTRTHFMMMMLMLVMMMMAVGPFSLPWCAVRPIPWGGGYPRTVKASNRSIYNIYIVYTSYTIHRDLYIHNYTMIHICTCMKRCTSSNIWVCRPIRLLKFLAACSPCRP